METRSIAIGLIAVVAAFAVAFGAGKATSSKTSTAGVGAQPIQVASPAAIKGVAVGGVMPGLQSSVKKKAPAHKKKAASHKPSSTSTSTASQPSTTKTTTASKPSTPTTTASKPSAPAPVSRPTAPKPSAPKPTAPKPAAPTTGTVGNGDG